MIYKATIAILLLALPAQADVFDNCMDATERGDRPAALAATSTILEITPAPSDLPDGVFRCFEFATGEQHIYVPSDQKIMSRSALQESLNNNIKSLVKQADDWQDKVRSRRISACKNLYKKDPDTTILNPICYDIFMVTGLPE